MISGSLGSNGLSLDSDEAFVLLKTGHGSRSGAEAIFLSCVIFLFDGGFISDPTFAIGFKIVETGDTLIAWL